MLPGRIDPGGGAIRVDLFLPDGKPLLDLFDHVPARCEGFFAVGCGSGDRYAGLAQRDETQAMLQHHAGAGPARVCVVEDPFDLADRHLVVRRVVDPSHVILAADCAEKDTGAATLRALDLGKESVDRYRRTSEMVRHGVWSFSMGTLDEGCDHSVQPPASGGNSATSSPSRTRASGFTCCRFTAVSGRGGRSRAPGIVSRTHSSTSATVAELPGTTIAADSRPVSSA